MRFTCCVVLSFVMSHVCFCSCDCLLCCVAVVACWWLFVCVSCFVLFYLQMFVCACFFVVCVVCWLFPLFCCMLSSLMRLLLLYVLHGLCKYNLFMSQCWFRCVFIVCCVCCVARVVLGFFECVSCCSVIICIH